MILMSNKIFKGEVVAKNGLTMECSSRDFSFILDEPKALGGSNKGMNPIEALLNSLGACKAIVARSFAKAKGFNFTELKIELEGTLDVDGFTGKNPNAKKGLTKIHSKYYIKTDEPDEKVEKFVKFMEETCPVRNTIVDKPEFTDEIIRL